MANFDDVTVFDGMSLSDLFKKIHKNNKDIDKQIGDFIDTLKPMATANAGSATMLMPTVKDLIDVNVKNNEQLIKMAGIAQRAATTGASTSQDTFFDPSEIQQLIDEQRVIQIDGQKLIEKTEAIQHQIENK